MKKLPSGILTFLFTDVEGSTRLAGQFGDARWGELLAAQREIWRRAFAAHDGIEVDAQGDAFFVVFQRASDALAAAIEGQRRLERHPWPEGGRVRVRAGLHTGEALARDDHYVGREVHRASRICDAGHGGQILVSQATAELLKENLAPGVALNDLGRHRLKDLDEAQRLFQVAAPGLPASFPPIRSREVLHNLPAERSSLFGREDDIEAVSKRLEAHRLVTLTGIGGSGKTRLAVRVARGLLDRFVDGVFFVDLAPVTEPELLTQTMAAACDLSLAAGPGGAGGSEEALLVAALASRQILVVLDNCEHVIDEAARIVDLLLERCSHLTVLATSREALGVDGEQVVRVSSLEVGDDPSSGQPAAAVRLFVDRANAAKRGFGLDAESRVAVIEICRRLDGIPLAIEFAAARVALLSPRQIAARLEDRFRLLTGGRRRVERQQTLAAALDWSHELLEPDEAALFRRLAVFSGSFSLEAAEAICAGDDLAPTEILGLLSSLCAKSLVTTIEGREGEARFRLLETVRMYAGEKLSTASESQTFRARHRDWFLAWIESIPLERLTFEPRASGAAAREIDNLRVAADWCLVDDRPDLLARLVTLLHGYWVETRGTSEEGARRCLQALEHESRLSKVERVACHATLAKLGFTELEHQIPSDEANLAIELADGEANPFVLLAYCTRAFASSIVAAFPGAEAEHGASARADAEAAWESARAGLADEWKAEAEYQGWMVETNIGDHAAAAQWARECVATCQGVRYPDRLLPRGLIAHAVSQHLLGDSEAAAHAAAQARAHPVSPDTPGLDQIVVTEITPALVQAGEDQFANQLLLDVGRSCLRSGIPLAANHLFTVIGVVDFLRGRPERTARLFAAVRHLGGAADLPIPFRTPATMSFYRTYLPRVREALGPEEARKARAAGRAMSLEEALAYALEPLTG